jgi:hypothetical protein
MSYSVNFYGHKDFESAAEVEAFEKDVIQRVTDFVHSLPGVGGGTINTSTQAQAVLQASDEAVATKPDGSPPAVEEVPADAKPAEVVPPANPTQSPVVPAVSSEPSDDGSSADLAELSTAELQAELARRSAQ